MAERISISLVAVTAMISSIAIVSCTCDPAAGEQSPLYLIQGADMTALDLYRHFRFSDKNKSMKYSSQFISECDSLAVNAEIATMCEELAEWHETVSFNYNEAICLLCRAIKIYDALKDNDAAATARLALAKIYFENGQYDKCLKPLTIAMKRFSKTGDRHKILEGTNLLGTIHYRCENYDKAYALFRETEKKARAENDSLILAISLNNIAAYDNNQRCDTLKARKLIRESITICCAMQDSLKLFTMLTNLANSYLSTGDHDKADRILAQMWTLAKNRKQTGTCHYMAGGIKYYNGDWDGCLEEMSSAMKYFKEGAELQQNIMDCMNVTWRAYAKKGDYENAYRTTEEYMRTGSNLDNISSQVFNQETKLLEERYNSEIIRKKYKIIISVISAVFVFILANVFSHIRYKKKEYAIKVQEAEIKSKKELMELKRMQQYSMDMTINAAADKLKKIMEKISSKTVLDELAEIRQDLTGYSHRLHDETRKYVPELQDEFQARLAKDWPDLTNNERRLCILLKMNMTTKEISSITKQSEHSIIIARSRLRHKFGITGSKMSLYGFLMKYD